MIGKPARCRHCHSTHIRRLRRTRFRTLTTILLIRPFGCETCGARMWRIAPGAHAAPAVARGEPPVAVAGG